MSKFLEVAIKAAEASGRILVRHFDKGVKAIPKGGMHYVTPVDYESQDAIKKILKKSYPDYNIFSEEAEYEDRGSDYTWYLDPLDGTHNYLRNIPIFGVSIALLHKNNVLLGVSYFPLQKRMYYAEKGKGAFMNGKRLHVSKFKPEHHYTVLVELKTESRKRLNKFLEVIETEKNRVRALACESYSLALLAEGNVDAFMPLDNNLYDVASGIILLEEAGGKATDLYGRKWTTATKDYIFSNGLLHNRISSFVRKAKI